MYLISILVQSQIQFQMAIKIMNTLALMFLFSAVAVKCHPGFCDWTLFDTGMVRCANTFCYYYLCAKVFCAKAHRVRFHC